MINSEDGTTPDKMELLNSIEMSLGSMGARRKMSDQQEITATQNLLQILSNHFSNQWFESEFHPIDENDPMLQAQASLKW